jgi:SAM-dependent methyltransferase
MATGSEDGGTPPMSSQPDTFGPLHANWYDRFHHRKDYRSEVDQMAEVVAPPASILDLGCGTGRHLELFAAAGYDVTGVDRSPAMVAAAKERLAPYGGRATVVESDLFDLSLDRTFDTVTMMSSLIGYQVENEVALATLAVAHRHLRPGGLLLFDVLDAGAVFSGRRPDDGMSAITEGSRQLLTAHSTRVNLAEQILTFTLRMWLLDDGRLIDHDEETHRVRVFLRRELELLLRAAGFDLLGSAPLAGEGAEAGDEWFWIAWARRT